MPILLAQLGCAIRRRAQGTSNSVTVASFILIYYVTMWRLALVYAAVGVATTAVVLIRWIARLGNLEYSIVPPKGEIPEYRAPVGDGDRKNMEQYWKSISDLQRHEDNLLHNRVRDFLVINSLLIAAFFQFRGGQYYLVQMGLCSVGLVFCFSALHVLQRTASAVQWYLAVLNRLDSQLFAEDQQPYLTRRRMTRSIDPTTGRLLRRPVSSIFGVFLPSLLVLVWVLLLTWSAYNAWETRPSGAKWWPC